MVRGRRNPLYLGFPARLRKARRERKLSCRRLAEMAGLSGPLIRGIEVGGVVAGTDTAERIAEALQISPSALVYGIEAPYVPVSKGEVPASLLEAIGLQASDLAGEYLRAQSISIRLMLAREARGLSARKLAAAAGLSHTALGHIERGRRIPSVATAEQLAKALQMSPAWLAYDEGDM